MQSAVDFREDIVNGVIKSFVFGVAVTWIALFEGYDALRHRGRRVRGHDPHSRDFFAGNTRAGFHIDGIYVSGGLMERSTLDLWVGMFVIAGIAALADTRAQGRQHGQFRRRRDLSAAGPV